eukprot:jgi/Botrbrau1/22643/Bobra.176_1s0065.1
MRGLILSTLSRPGSRIAAGHLSLPKKYSRINSRECASVRAEVKGKRDVGEEGTSDLGLGLKAVWYGAEQFGNLVGLTKQKQSDTEGVKSDAVQLTREQVVASIKEDYSVNYFVSGQGNMAAYAEDCLFADPFAGFKGVQRFKRNVSNLGGLLEGIKLELLDWKEDGDEIRTKWRFSAILGLPWRPRLAAAGGTTHVIDPGTGKVVKHIESWDIEPGKVVRQLLKPASRVPGNRWEAFFAAADSGDLKGLWVAGARPVAFLCTPIVAVSLAVKAVTGEGLQGVFLGAVEGLAYLGLAAALLTELYQASNKP